MVNFERFIFYSLILLLPTQFGKHFWPDFTIVSGIRIDYLSPITYVTDLLITLLFCVFLVQTFQNLSKFKIKDPRFNIQRKSKRWYLIGIAIALFFITNILFSSRPLVSIYGLIKLGEFAFLVFYVSKTVIHYSQLRKIALLFAISSLFESILAILQYVHQGSLNGIFYFLGERTFTGSTPGIANASLGGILVLRPYATFSHPNVLAGYLLVAMVMVWSFVLTNKKKWIQIIGMASLLTSSVALLLTFSRVAILLWGVFLLGVLVKVLFYKTKSLKAKVTIVAIIVVGLVMISFLPMVHDIVLRFSQTSLSDESVTERAELLATASVMIHQHPLFGIGFYNFIPTMAPLQKPLPLGLYLQPVHNIFVLVAAETGVVGLGLFVWLLGATILRIKKQELRIKRTLFVLLFIILATGMFDHYWLTLQQGQLLFAVVLGVSWAKLQKSA